MRDHTHPAIAFHAMALVASARTALATARGVADRRAGRDPSAQEEAAVAAADARALAGTLGALVARLRLRAAVGAPAAPAAALAQAFEDRLLVADLAAALARVHQKLLSLYPAVGSDVVEGARVMAREADRAVGGDATDADLSALAARVGAWLDGLGEALA